MELRLDVDSLLDINKYRLKELEMAEMDQLTGEGIPIEAERRVLLSLEDSTLPKQWIPESMAKEQLVRELMRYGRIDDFIEKRLEMPYTLFAKRDVDEALVRLRIRYDFLFWAYYIGRIKDKRSGLDIPFRLNHAQLKLLKVLEEQRLKEVPIRVILVKARQWGGSTLVQMYMAWIQLVHKTGWNSLIVGNQNSASAEVKGMYEKMLSYYDESLLYPQGANYKAGEPKIVGVAESTNIKLIPSRNCKIKIASVKNPDSPRGGDSSMVHCTEVGFWEKTEKMSPADMVRSATAGTLYLPYTMIVYESTANGTGNFFHTEYVSAKEGKSMFVPLFIPWYDILNDTIPFRSEKEQKAFAEKLLKNKDQDTSEDSRSEPGQYLWYLWQSGATLEGIHWYTEERKKYSEHGDMASENPSNDIEAFQHSGHKVFDMYRIESLRSGVRDPKYIGELVSKGDAHEDPQFVTETNGNLKVWHKPESLEELNVLNRYIVSVDVGGRWHKADWSVICVIDRYWMIDDDKPVVVAQWRGHIDKDLLGWKALEIARWYNNALLVIESNSLESATIGGSESSDYILNQIKEVYDNLYTRQADAADVRERKPTKYGFHTNRKTKRMVIDHLIKVLRTGAYVERDAIALEEYYGYQETKRGVYEAIEGGHDDVLMTRAIGLYVCFNEMDDPLLVSKDRATNTIPKYERVHSAAKLI